MLKPVHKFIKIVITVLLPVIVLLLAAPRQTALSQSKYKGGPPPQYAQNPKFKTDLEFAKMLKQNWMKTELLPGLALDKKPKPSTPPSAQPTAQDTKRWQAARKVSRPVKFKDLPQVAPVAPSKKLPTRIPIEPQTPIKEPPLNEPDLQQENPQTPQPEPPQPISEPHSLGALRSVGYTFFDEPIRINYDPMMAVSVGGSISNQSIADYWEEAAKTNPDPFLSQIDAKKSELNLNDWGYYLLLQKSAEGIYGGSGAASNLLTWYFLVKSGYDARAGFYGNQVFLLIPSKELLYEVPNFTIGGKKYYLLSKVEPGTSLKSLFVYNSKYPGADKSFDVMMISPPNLKRLAQNRTLKFDYEGKDYVIEAQYDKNLVDFCNDYPQTDLMVYFDASPSAEAANSLLDALAPIIAGKSEADAVNIILRFVQTAFDYKTDGDQFGREKYFFPEESLYYPYNDCEDRSILFSYLVRKLTGLEVVGLDYPGHVAAAVRFSDNLPGDSVTYNGKRFVICDPTYIGADIGMAQTAYKTVKPTVIPIRA